MRPGRLELLVNLTTPVALGGGIVKSLTGLLRGRPLADVLSTAVSLAVAAVPEGLPMLATLAQVSAAGRLSERGVLVRNPRAIEALGRTTVVCLDKTGTVTEGRIALKAVWDGAREEQLGSLGAAARAILCTAVRATPEPAPGKRLPHGTDRAPIDGAQRAGIEGGAWSRQAELPFESERGFHAVLAVGEDGLVLSVKGAPESVVLRCDRFGTLDDNARLDESARERIERAARHMARRGLRVLAIAETRTATNGALNDDRVRELVFRGLLGFADPLRPTAVKAVSGLREAGIRLVMLTGDHPITAESIGAELGLLDGEVLTGGQIDAVDDAELVTRVARTSVFARVAPRHKARLVRAFQAAGMVVAITGDGANDAPAIRLADVGIAIGIRRTTAARQAADVVVTNDQIETLVHAVLEGRTLWSSVRDAVAVLLGGNLGGSRSRSSPI
jgi:cation-transporting ATPase I